MMDDVEVTVAVFATLREIIGQKEVKLRVKRGSTVKGLIELLGEKFNSEVPEKVLNEDGTDLSENFRVLVNGRSVSLLKGIETELMGGERVSIFPPVGGG